MRADSRRVAGPELIGRAAEIAVLDAAVERIDEGRASIAIVGGEAGMGKTRLVDALEAATSTIRFLRGTCLAFGASTPYLPLAEIMRDLLSRLDADDVDTIVGPARPELARFLPELASPTTRPAVRATMSGDLERLRMYEALLRVAERVAVDHPTAFVIEDVQWIDTASLELLSFLSHSISRGEMMLIVTVRSDVLEDAPAVASFLVDLERRADVDRIELGPLGADDTRRLMEGITGSPVALAAAERVATLSGGNPLFIEELVGAVDPGGEVDLGAPRLRDLIGARIGRLPASTLPVLRAASIAGGEIDAEQIATVLDVDAHAVERALEAAVAGHVLVRPLDGGDGLRFRHEIVRSVVAAQLGPTEARRMHAAFADAVEAGDPDPTAMATLAFHRDAAAQTGASVVAHARSAMAAETALAYADAHRHYVRVLEDWSAVDDAAERVGMSHAGVRFAAAATAARSGLHAEAIALSRRLIDDDAEGDVELRELARSSLRWYLWEAGRTDEALANARAALELDDVIPDVWRANARVHLAALLVLRGDVADARMAAEEAREEAEAMGALAEQAMADGVLGWCLILEGDVDDGLTRIRHAVHLAAELEVPIDGGSSQTMRYPTGRVLAYAQLTNALQLAGRLDDAMSAARDGLAVATTQGLDRTYGPRLVMALADAAYHLGAWDVALEELAAGAGTAVDPWRAVLAASTAVVAASRGDDEACERALASVDRAGGVMRPEAIRRAAVARAERAAWQRRPLEALMALRAALDASGDAVSETGPGRPIDLDMIVPRSLTVASRAAADLMMSVHAGATDESVATAALDRLREVVAGVRERPGLAELWAADLSLVDAEMARADDGPRASTASSWSTAAEALAGRPYEEAYARWRLAEALFAERDHRADAERELARARSLVEPLGAAPLLAAIDGLAQRAGVREGGPGSRAGTDERPYGLTQREVEVLALLADGRSNADIADELFISPKTASVHVSNIYGKLGVESRVAAATMAIELGLTGTVPRDDEDHAPAHG